MYYVETRLDGEGWQHVPGSYETEEDAIAQSTLLQASNPKLAVRIIDAEAGFQIRQFEPLE
ncbi:hypothetical protein [Thioalkalivibrio sp. HK1]|uniref:hypothetical protein n=1 Tax=Thioalkalivibrio sp. HK1 TaxID=1469245 RepID=UPI000470FDC5|nr:hypothetical protein [Thioalkalivibrio sp. HK1]